MRKLCDTCKYHGLNPDDDLYWEKCIYCYKIETMSNWEPNNELEHVEPEEKTE